MFPDILDERTKDVIAAGVPTEAQMRDEKVPTFDTIEELGEYINKLVDRPHDYGTCVYAMSMAATAAFQFVARGLAVTGFQASVADMDILSRTRGWKWGMLLDFEKLLYPQHLNDHYFPSWATLVKNNQEKLAEKAKELIKKNDESEHKAHPDVLNWWKALAIFNDLPR